jgi:hypothetical protein
VARPDGPGLTVPHGGGATPNRFSFQRAHPATGSADSLGPAAGVFCCLEVYVSRPAGRLGEPRGVGGRSRGVRGRSAGSGHPPAGGFHPPAGAIATPAGRDRVLADAGWRLAGSGRSSADTGQSPSGLGRPPTDAGRSIAGTGRSMADTGPSTAATGRSTPESGEPCSDRLLPSLVGDRISESVSIYVLCCSLSPGDRRRRGEGGSLTTESDRGRKPNRPRSNRGCDARRRERAPPFPASKGDGGALVLEARSGFRYPFRTLSGRSPSRARRAADF